MELEFLGGAGEVGKSSVFLQTDSNLLLDCGIKVNDEQAYPMPPPEEVDAAIISHAHMDHLGFLPSLFDSSTPDVITTPPTREIGALLLEDSAKIITERTGSLPYRHSSYKRAMNAFKVMGYGVKKRVNDTTITFNDAGHVPGASSILVEYEGKRILYSGDFKLSETRMHHAAKVPKNIDILITESTYFSRDHPKRKDLEIQLVERCDYVLSKGGNVLLPAFAVGRTQELIMALRAHRKDYKIWVDGMGIKASKIAAEFPSYIKNAKRFKQDFAACNIVRNWRQRNKVLSEPSIIISTAGMMQGGPALGYLLSLNENSECIFTGYCVEGTNGYNLLQHGFVEKDGEKVYPSTPIKYLDFSAHAGRSELFEFARKSGAKKVFCMHGDDCQSFADELQLEGFDAVAPKIGERFSV